MASPSAAVYRASMVAERDKLRQSVVSAFAGNDAGGRTSADINELLRQAALLTAAVAELDAAAP